MNSSIAWRSRWAIGDGAADEGLPPSRPFRRSLHQAENTCALESDEFRWCCCRVHAMMSKCLCCRARAIAPSSTCMHCARIMHACNDLNEYSYHHRWCHRRVVVHVSTAPVRVVLTLPQVRRAAAGRAFAFAAAHAAHSTSSVSVLGTSHRSMAFRLRRH